MTTEFVNSQSFDGDNQTTHYALVRNTTFSNPQLLPGSSTFAEAYLLRSTVLGGSLISEYKGDGTWSKSHVYAGGERLGQQTTAEVGTAQSILENLDPVTGDGMKRLANGNVFGTTTMDPGGVNVGVSDPFPPDGSGDEDGLIDGAFGKSVASLIPIEGFGAKCILDGLEIDCSRIRGDASVQCPNNDCSATITITGRHQGRVVGRWIIFAPEGWDPSFDGTYTLGRDKRERLVWKRKSAGSSPAQSFAFDKNGVNTAGIVGSKPVDWSVLQNSLKTCIHELWPNFEMTSFKPTAAPNLKSKDHDQYNGVIGLRDVKSGSKFSVTNDPTPYKEVRDMIIQEKSRGATDALHPFWNYAYPAGDPTARPGELRYPELFGDMTMTYVRVQIHETGASLSAIRDMYYASPGVQFLSDGGLYPSQHEDDGPALEDCVGRTYYKQLGLTPAKLPWEP